jgi:hypothetical protein
VTAVELVTADGELRRVDRENDPENVIRSNHPI